MFFTLFFLLLSLITLSTNGLLSVIFLGVAVFAFKLRNKKYQVSTQDKKHLLTNDFNEFEIGLKKSFLHNDD